MPALATRPKTIPFPLPTLGLVTVTARAGQPARASVDMRNVRIFGADDRMRISTRGGTKRLYSVTMDKSAGGDPAGNREVLLCHAARFQDSGGNAASFLIHVCTGHVWKAVMGSGTVVTSLTDISTTGGSGQTFLPAHRVYAVTDGAYTFMIDGSKSLKLKLDGSGTIADLTTWTATTAGTVPTDYRLMIFARGRIYMALEVNNPQNWACSRQGDPFDWDTTADDVGAPVVGNDGFRGGQIGQPIRALIAGKDDTVIFACKNAIYELVGEPTLGSLLVRSTGIGILTPDSWCMGPSGEIYFVAEGGFYRLPVSGSPEPLSNDKVGSYFQDIPDTGYWVNCVWDSTRFGVHIYITPDTSGAASHLFFNLGLGTFEPEDFPDDHGPITACLYNGGSAGSRFMVLGGRKGIVMYPTDAVYHDESSSATNGANVAITQQFFMGPLRPNGPVDQAKMIEFQVNLGEPPSGFSSSDFNVTYTVQAGPDAYGAYASPTGSFTGTFAGVSGRQPGIHQRLRGGDFFVKFANSTIDKCFVIDQVLARFLPGGRDR